MTRAWTAALIAAALTVTTAPAFAMHKGMMHKGMMHHGSMHHGMSHHGMMHHGMKHHGMKHHHDMRPHHHCHGMSSGTGHHKCGTRTGGPAGGLH